MAFITDDFCLRNKTGRTLYKKFAKDLPIIDYHCHIDASDIALDRKFDNLTQLWLYGDHYKWRLMRNNGVPEKNITGDADDRTKFLEFAATLERAFANPVYHWVHLELKKYFGYDGVLNTKTANEVFEMTAEKLRGSLTAKKIIEMSNVKFIGTTDDPTDTLENHRKIFEDVSFKTVVAPSFRPDKALNIEKPGFSEYIDSLSKSAEMRIENFDDLKAALSRRLEYFVKMGCRSSDHSLDRIPYTKVADKKINDIFKEALCGKIPCAAEADAYKTELLLYLAEEYKAHGIVMQLHYGAHRNPNDRAFQALGADSGFDCILAGGDKGSICEFLSDLYAKDSLPKTVIYSLDPNDNAMLDSVVGSFPGEHIRGKVQHGTAWWFSDTKSGIEEHLRELSSHLLLGSFIGMLTDSRSLLSYTRHDYFRRILCNFIGDTVESGEYPKDIELLGKMVEDISYNNAAKFFNI